MFGVAFALAAETEAADAEEAEAAAKDSLYAVFTGQSLAVGCTVMAQLMKPDKVGARGGTRTPPHEHHPSTAKGQSWWAAFKSTAAQAGTPP